MRDSRLTCLALASLLLAPVVTSTAADPSVEAKLSAMERAIAAQPEDLRLCADYRQQVIAVGQFDRSIRLLERLTGRPGAGPNAYLSLALAYVDKVPAASPFRRIFLGRDALNAASASIARRPSPVAYYVRGLLSLYLPEALFHRLGAGVADLEYVRDVMIAQPLQAVHARVYVSLGDGYWKIHQLPKAISIWTDGLRKFPTNAELRGRLANTGVDLDRIVERSLDPARRVDTSLQDLFTEASVP